MRSIDLVKHQTRILPGLEEALQTLLGRMTESRKLLNLPPLILVEDPDYLKNRIKEIRTRLSRERMGMGRTERKKAEAELVRLRIARQENQRADKQKLSEFRRKLKAGTLIERPDPAIEEWKEGSSAKPAPIIRRAETALRIKVRRA